MSVFYFSVYRSCTYFLKCISKCLLLILWVILHGIVFLILFSACSFLVPGNGIDFCVCVDLIFTHYYFRRLVDYLEFTTEKFMPFASRDSLISFFIVHMPYFVFSLSGEAFSLSPIAMSAVEFLIDATINHLYLPKNYALKF